MAGDAGGLAERFFKLYGFLPIEERKLTVAIVDDEPVNWARAHEEIKKGTPFGRRILKKLADKGII